MSTTAFVIVRMADGFDWRLVAEGEVVAAGGPFPTKEAALLRVQAVRELAPAALVEDA